MIVLLVVIFSILQTRTYAASEGLGANFVNFAKKYVNDVSAIFTNALFSNTGDVIANSGGIIVDHAIEAGVGQGAVKLVRAKTIGVAQTNVVDSKIITEHTDHIMEDMKDTITNTVNNTMKQQAHDLEQHAAKVNKILVDKVDEVKKATQEAIRSVQKEVKTAHKEVTNQLKDKQVVVRNQLMNKIDQHKEALTFIALGAGVASAVVNEDGRQVVLRGLESGRKIAHLGVDSAVDSMKRVVEKKAENPRNDNEKRSESRTGQLVPST